MPTGSVGLFYLSHRYRTPRSFASGFRRSGSLCVESAGVSSAVPRNLVIVVRRDHFRSCGPTSFTRPQVVDPTSELFGDGRRFSGGREGTRGSSDLMNVSWLGSVILALGLRVPLRLSDTQLWIYHLVELLVTPLSLGCRLSQILFLF